MRRSTRSISDGDTSMVPTHRHRPLGRSRRPACNSWLTNWCKNKTLPRVKRHMRSAQAVLIGPPRAACSKMSDSLRDSGWRSSRCKCPSFHSAVTASGAGAPVRIVAITVAARRNTN